MFMFVARIWISNAMCRGLHSFADASLVLTEISSSDVTTTSEYVITISCTDGIDTTFFDLTLLLTSKDSAVTEKTDLTPIIIGASIGGLFIVLILVIMVVLVRKRQHKHNDESSVYETPIVSCCKEPHNSSTFRVPNI
jgi:hypothetical protein